MQEQPEPISDQVMVEAMDIVNLIAKFVLGSLSEEEHDRLDTWVATNDDNMRLFENLTDAKKNQLALSMFTDVDSDSTKALKKIKKKLRFTGPRFPSGLLNRILYLTALVA